MGSAGSAGRERQSRRLTLSLCHPAGAASSPSFLARIPRAAAGLLSAGLLVAFSALFATEAGAQTTTLISNVAQDDGTLNLPSPAAARVGPSGNNTFTQAQQFTTGDNEGGYTLTEVVAYIRNFEGSDAARVSVYTADSDGDPGSSEHVLTGMITDKSLNTFTALPNATLAKETEYFVVFEATAGFYSLGTTTTDKLDANPANEWSINNERHYKLSDTGDWTTSSKEARIQIKGTAGGTAATVPDAPQEFTATAGFSSATLAWQPPSNEGGSPILGYQYQYKQGDGTYYDWTDIRNSESLTSHVLSRGAAPNTTVTYKLRAKNLIGGGATAEQSVTFAGALTVRWAETALSFAEAAGDVQFEVVAETATGGVKPDSNFQVVLSKLSLTATPGTLAEGGGLPGDSRFGDVRAGGLHARRAALGREQGGDGHDSRRQLYRRGRTVRGHSGVPSQPGQLLPTQRRRQRQRHVPRGDDSKRRRDQPSVSPAGADGDGRGCAGGAVVDGADLGRRQRHHALRVPAEHRRREYVRELDGGPRRERYRHRAG